MNCSSVTWAAPNNTGRRVLLRNQLVRVDDKPDKETELQPVGSGHCRSTGFLGYVSGTRLPRIDWVGLNEENGVPDSSSHLVYHVHNDLSTMELLLII